MGGITQCCALSISCSNRLISILGIVIVDNVRLEVQGVNRSQFVIGDRMTNGLFSVSFSPCGVDHPGADADDQVCEEKRDRSVPVEGEVNLHEGGGYAGCRRCGFPLDRSSVVCAFCGYENE